MLCELIENNRKVPLWEISGTFGAIPVETGEQPMKVLIMSNMLARWALEFPSRSFLHVEKC